MNKKSKIITIPPDLPTGSALPFTMPRGGLVGTFQPGIFGFGERMRARQRVHPQTIPKRKPWTLVERIGDTYINKKALAHMNLFGDVVEDSRESKIKKLLEE